jgi:site-specific DNA-cytosine methylase
LEFFAGIGLARLGLEAAGFRVVWSNDSEPDKQAMYQGNFGASPDHRFVLGDVAAARGQDLPVGAALAGVLAVRRPVPGGRTGRVARRRIGGMMSLG